MDYASGILQHEKEQIIERMRQGADDLLAQLQSIDKALSWLRVIEENKLKGAWKYDVHQLPIPDDGVAHYHLMVDTDYDGFDDPAYWSLYKPDSEQELDIGMWSYIVTSK